MTRGKKRSRKGSARAWKAGEAIAGEEQQVWDALDQAQKQVKHIVDREKQSERLGKDILSLRLKKA